MASISMHSNFSYVDQDYSYTLVSGVLTIAIRDLICLYAKRLPVVEIHPYPGNFSHEEKPKLEPEPFDTCVTSAEIDELKTFLRFVRNGNRKFVTAVRLKPMFPLLGPKFDPDGSSAIAIIDYLGDSDSEAPRIMITMFYFGGLVIRPMLIVTSMAFGLDSAKIIGPFVMGKSNSRSEKFCRELWTEIPDLESVMTRLTCRLIQRFTRNGNDILNNMIEFQHSPSELYFLEKFISNLENRNQSLLLAINVIRVINQKYLTDDDDRYPMDVDKLRAYRDMDWKGTPFFDLNMREWKFIANYTESGKYLSHPKYDSFVLREAFADPRYGQRFQVKYEEVETDDLILNIYTEVDRYTGTLIARYDTDDMGYSAYMIVSTDFTYESKLHNIFREMKLVIGINASAGLPGNEADLLSKFPDLLLDRNELMSIYHSLISLLMTVHLRPDRTRMIRETRKVDYDSTGRSIPVENDDQWVTRYILRSASEAREQVRLSGATSNLVCEYVVPEWEREAHTRTLSNGKVIHVDKHTVTRRKPLTEKSVRFKL